MTQLQFEMICKIIESGAPALSGELCSSLNDLVLERNQLVQEVDNLKTQSTATKPNDSGKKEDGKQNKPSK